MSDIDSKQQNKLIDDIKSISKTADNNELGDAANLARPVFKKAADFIKDPEFLERTLTSLRKQYPDLSEDEFAQAAHNALAKFTPDLLAKLDDLAEKAMSGVKEDLEELYSGEKTIGTESAKVGLFKEALKPMEMPAEAILGASGKYHGYLSFSLGTDLVALPLNGREKYELSIAAANINRSDKEGYAHFATDANITVFVADNIEHRQQIFSNLPRKFSGTSNKVSHVETAFIATGTDESGKQMTAIIIPREYLDRSKQDLLNYGREYELQAGRNMIYSNGYEGNYAEYLSGLNSSDINDLGYLKPLPKNADHELAKTNTSLQH